MKKLLTLALALLLLLSACGGKGVEVTPTPSPAPEPTARLTPTPAPTPEPTPYNGPENPLTGLPIDEKWVNRRPVAVMLNNIKEALPQLGVSQADILYEVPAEGGITRMLGVYQTTEGVGAIGSIRSARPYYLELALGHDAIFIHAGGSEDAYAKIKAWGVTALDGVRGPYMGGSPGANLMWRDPERRKHYSLEHTVVTTGDNVVEKLERYDKLRLDHREGYRYQMGFAEDGAPVSGTAANVITVPFSYYKTGVFTYDPQQRRYKVDEYGKAYVDGDSGEQVAVTNVIILKTACRNTGDHYGHVTVDLSSGGTGYFACGGKMIDIRWSKAFPDGQLLYTDLDGVPITLGRGHSYVCVVPTSEEVGIEG